MKRKRAIWASSLYDATSKLYMNKKSQNNSEKHSGHLQNIFRQLPTSSFVQIFAVGKESVLRRDNSHNALWSVLHLSPLLIKFTYAFPLCFLRGQNAAITHMPRPLPRHHFSNSPRGADSRSKVRGCAPFASWQ